MPPKTPKSPLSTRRKLLAALSAIPLANLAACDKLGISTPTKLQFASIDITGADYAKGFALKDASGQLRKLSDFSGKAVVVFFGFVQCPDVCPTTMAELAEVKKLLGPQGDKLQSVFVTVDPERDTPEVLRAYTQGFDANLIALIPSAAELEALAKDFKVYYKKVPGKTPTSYAMDHTAHGYVFDPAGRIRLVARYGIGAKALAADIKMLLA
jgi:protein SCO1